MIAYLLKSAICLGLLLVFYFLVLEREKMHNFNRFYLLGSVLFSFLAPLCIISIEATPVIIETMDASVTFYPSENIVTEQITIEKPIDYQSIILILYGIISLTLLTRFGRNLFHIIKKTRKNIKITHQTAILVLVDDDILPHTFWNYIFINKNDYDNKKIERELFTHELTHVTQKHTIDVLILELIQCIFWINPFFILLKKAIQLNHEFLADEKVIDQHNNTFQYQHLLLNKAAWKNEYYLASNLNYSLTKKRLKMMTTQSSPTKILLKKLAVIPLLAGFIFLFAERVEAQEIIEKETEKPIETIVEEVSSKKQDFSKSELYKEYFYSKNGVFSFKDNNGKKIVKKYNELNDVEKKKLVPPPPLKLSKNIPTKKQFEDLKDSKKYVVWIDGKVVKNSILYNYQYTDFVRYSKSHIYKNARSNRFPQENQVHLETEKYFKFQNNKRVEKFLKYLKEKHNIQEIEEEIKSKVLEEKQKKSKPDYIDSPIPKYNYPSNASKQSIPIKANEIIDIREKLKNINTVELIDSTNRHPNTGFKLVRGIMLYYVTTNGKIKYYNKEGKLFNKNGDQISNKKAKASEIIPDNYIKRVFYRGEVFCEFIDDKPNLSKNNTSNSFTKQLEKINKNKRSSFKNIESTDSNVYLAKPEYTVYNYKKPTKKTTYYVNGEKTLFKDLKIKIKSYEIESTRIEEQTDGSQIIYITSKSLIKQLNKSLKRSTENKNKSNNPTLQLIEKLAQKEAKFYFENKQISAAQALKLAGKFKIRVESESTNNGNYIANLYKNHPKKERKNKRGRRNSRSGGSSREKK